MRDKQDVLADGHKDIKNIAKEVRAELKKALPACTFSVKIERYAGGRSLSVYCLEAPEATYIDQTRGHCDINEYHIDESTVLTPYGVTIGKTIIKIANKDNWDNSDPMTDYFDVNYYTHLAFGKWDKYFQVTKKAA